MAFGRPNVQKIQTDHLPSPTAASYHLIFTGHEPGVERHRFMLDAAEVTTQRFAMRGMTSCLNQGVKELIPLLGKSTIPEPADA